MANEACDQGRVSLNQKPAKASAEVKVGDVIEIRFGERIFKAEILNIAEHVLKNDASEMYKVL